MPPIRFELLNTFDSMQTAVDLQQIYWGTNIDSLVPVHMLYSIASAGGHVIMAMDDEKAIGVLIGFVGIDSQRPFIFSKRMVVLPEYRGQGIGYQLKLKQRELALNEGIDLVKWTFDPLLTPNAHLNIHKLGGISCQFLEDYYGTSRTNGLTSQGTSDRLLVDWHLNSQAVIEVVQNRRVINTLSNYLGGGVPIINPVIIETGTTEDILIPPEKLKQTSHSQILLQVPINHPNMVKDNEMLAWKWRTHIRYALKELFQQGYIVTNFVRWYQQAYYLLSKDNHEIHYN